VDRKNTNSNPNAYHMIKGAPTTLNYRMAYWLSLSIWVVSMKARVVGTDMCEDPNLVRC
jgi:hypothetical protein